MREEETYTDLAALFAEEDKALAPAPFVARIMARVKRQSVLRTLVLAGVGAIGAGIAISQLPNVLADSVIADGAFRQLITNARTDVSSVAAADPLWMMIGAGIVFCLGAVAALERA